MKNKTFLSFALLIVAVTFSASAFAQTPTLNGKWTGSIDTPDGNSLPVTYNFKVDGNKLTGTAESPAGTAAVDDGKITGDAFTFSVTVDGNAYPHSGKLHGDTCDLDIDFGGQKVHVTIKRAPNK